MGITQFWAVASNMQNTRDRKYHAEESFDECREYAWADRGGAVFGTSNPKFMFKKWCKPFVADIRKADMKELPAKEIVDACEDFTKATLHGPIYGILYPSLWNKGWCAGYSRRIREVRFEMSLERIRQESQKWEEQQNGGNG